jgi:hypothetical protein
MHVGWSADLRPAWRFRCAYDLVAPVAPAVAAPLEQALEATGKVRRPRVRVADGGLVVVLAVEGDDDLQASATGLGALDVAARRVGGISLGALRAYGATRLGPWS